MITEGDCLISQSLAVIPPCGSLPSSMDGKIRQTDRQTKSGCYGHPMLHFFFTWWSNYCRHATIEQSTVHTCSMYNYCITIHNSWFFRNPAFVEIGCCQLDKISPSGSLSPVPWTGWSHTDRQTDRLKVVVTCTYEHPMLHCLFTQRSKQSLNQTRPDDMQSTVCVYVWKMEMTILTSFYIQTLSRRW